MAFYGASSSSSSSFSSISRWTYDVFLSFRGEDTRKTFTAHLYSALRRNGINTFMDDKLRSGEEITPALLEAIQESEISIIVLSQNYASSRWCLDELLEILECRKTRKQQVLPLFYNVDPSEVRNQTNSIGKAFTQLEKRFKDEMKVKGWKTALTEVANLSGMHLGNRNEPEFIDEIIERVNFKLVKKTCFQVAQYLVGIEFHVQDLKLILDIEKNESTCMLGIFGVGGIGKTTLAKAIYNSIASQFESSCFLENIRETSNQKGLIHLQNKLLSISLRGSSLMVDNVDQGITLIQKRLHQLRILVVLDDVDHSDHLEKIVGKGNWFGLGSRIIITTRDKHLLTKHQVLSYEVKELDCYKALQLFSWHAFNKYKPNDDYVKITEDVVHYTGGLPLALTVLGSALKGRDILYWKSKLNEYKIIPHNDIQKKLRISFDGLDENAKNIFLDIACFFKGKNVKYVTKILDNTRGFQSYTGIEELKNKCLITQSWNSSLEMHDLLQEMGREIVRQESPNQPGKRSRLWFHEDVRDVLEGNTGTNKVEGMLICVPKPDLIHLSPNAFKKMERLKMFININACFSEEPSFLSNELRLFDWPNYPGESLPSNFCGKNLVILVVPHSRLKELDGVKNFQNMTCMNFSFCEFLRKLPDVSRIPNLEELDLEFCKNLVEVHHSVGFHNKLVSLNVGGCSNLKIFPRSLKMRSLKFLSLGGCSKLKNFPKIECQMECLEYINFGETGIEELPSSIGYLTGVKTLNLNGCTSLMDLPYSIHKLQHWERLSIGNMDRIVPPCLGLPYSNYQLCHLEHLSLSGCSKVIEFLKVVENTRQSMPVVVSMEQHEISPVAELLPLLPSTNTSDCFSIVFPKLRKLDLDNCDLSESNFFRTFDCCSKLTELELSMSDIITLPLCIGRFVRLKTLVLKGCKALKEILGLPPNVKRVEASGCVSLAIFLEEDKRSQLINTPEALFQVGTVFPALILGNQVLTESDFLIQPDYLSSLKHLNLSSSTIVSLPAWLNKFVGLEDLYLNGCKQLREIPELPPNIEKVYAKGCTSLERFQFNNVKDLPMLKWINFSGCHGLRENMGDDLEICLMSMGHSKEREFGCIFPGNKIPDYFSYHKEVSNANSCEIDIKEHVHLDLENTRFAFSAVIGTDDIRDADDFGILVEFINDIGQKIYSHSSRFMDNPVDSHVWMNFHCSHHSQLKMDNLQVKFTITAVYASMYFKSCGFQIVAGQ